MIKYRIPDDDKTLYLIGDYIFTYYVGMQKFANKIHKIVPSIKERPKVSPLINQSYKEMPFSDFNLEDQVIEIIFSRKLEISDI